MTSTYIIFMVPAFVLMAVAQWWVSSTYRRWGQTKNSLGMNGQDAAQRLLAQAGLPGVEVAGVQGRLSDHYDPRTCELHLSPEVAGVPSVASLAITAHEIGHAMQDRDGYAPLRIRSALVPAASIGSNLGWILLLIGLILGFFEAGSVGPDRLLGRRRICAGDASSRIQRLRPSPQAVDRYRTAVQRRGAGAA